MHLYSRILLNVVGTVLCAQGLSFGAPCPVTYADRFAHWVIKDFNNDGRLDDADTDQAVVALTGNDRGLETGRYFDQQTYSWLPCDCPSGNAHRDCRADAHWHMHWRHDLPMTAVLVRHGGTIKVTCKVTWPLVEEFWDWEYDGYARQGSHDLSMNCYGYAMGPPRTWMTNRPHSVGIVLANCWASSGLANAQMALGAGHAIKIESTAFCTEPEGETGTYVITATSEKFRESPIYTRTGGCAAPVKLKDKFKGPEPDLQLSP